MDYMKLWHYAADNSCNTKNFEVQLLKPPWFNGLIVETSVKVSEINLNLVAFFIYLFSTSFQLFRYSYFDTYFIPQGPEFSRWLEYAFTSPLQVLLVALAFNIKNIDVLLGYFGMQLALVIMGYNIEEHIERVYTKDPSLFSNFSQVFKTWGVSDIRGFVYLLVCWTLHLLIWGIPGLWHSDFIRWGISGDYAYAHKYQKACFHDEEFQMPGAIDVIFWSQYIIFTVFGVVCSVQFVFAYSEPLVSRWREVSWSYAILSVSAKTILELGFLMLLLTSKEWLEFTPVPKASVVRYPNITYWKDVENHTYLSMISANTTCFSIAP